MIFAGIVAGGTGSRMGANIPKQFLELSEKPILIHTIEKFLAVSIIDKIYVGVHSDWLEHTKKLIADFNLDAQRIKIIVGGNNRNSTVFNIVSEIETEFNCSENDIILTHDAVRPFVTTKIITDNIESAKKNDACTTAISATDTMLYSEDNQHITSTPERSKMYHAQTPQTFKIKALLSVYNSLTNHEKILLTDTCSIFTTKGMPVKIVNGDVSNIKLTTPYDLKIAQNLFD